MNILTFLKRLNCLNIICGNYSFICIRIRNYKYDIMVPRCDSTIARCYNKIAILTICFLFAALSIISGQNRREEKPPLRERLFFGGSLGLQFGSITQIQVTPIVGLWVLPRVAIALGPNYQYYKDPYFHTTLYGGNGYLEFVPLRDLNNVIPIGIHTGILLHLEDELLSLESAVWNPQNPDNRFIVNTVLGGLGISQQLGVRSSMNLLFLWALNDSGYGLYNNPVIRLSFSF